MAEVAPTESKAPRSRVGGALRDAGVGLGVALALFLVAEVALRLLGVATPGSGQDPLRGFGASERMLVPDPKLEGGWMTRVRDTPGSERRLPPKGSKQRVLLFGGSNVDGMKAQELEQFLAARGGAERFEVFNLGRSGFGSGRVTRLFVQAVSVLEPDLCVIYAGHNEFVERSFKLDIEDQLGAAGGALAALAARSHVVSGVMELVQGPAAPQASEQATEGPDDSGDPDAATRAHDDARWNTEYAKFADLPYTETLAVYAQYEENLRLMCRAARERGVDVLLSTVVHNRMSAPFVSGCAGVVGGDPDFAELRKRIQRTLPTALEPILADDMQARVHGWSYRSNMSRAAHRKAIRQDKDYAEVQRGMRPCTGPFADARRGLGPIALFDDHVNALLDALEAFWSGALVSAEREARETAEVLLLRAVEACPDHARSLFELGLVELALGRDRARAVQRLEDAARFDHAPRKASELVNDIVRRVATEHPEVHFHDGDAALRAWMPDGLVGWEWMYDHCHLNDGAKSVLLDEFSAPIVRALDTRRGE